MMSPRPHRAAIGKAGLLAIGAAIVVSPAAADMVQKAATAVAPQRAAPSQALPDGNPVQAIPLSALAITRDRPIFSPSRRPPPRPAAAPIYSVASAPRPAKVEPQRPSLTLVGTIIGGNEAIAVFLDRTSREVVRLHPSESHDGWVLRSIEGREATLEKGPDAAVLALAPPGATPEIATAQATPEQLRRRTRQSHE